MSTIEQEPRPPRYQVLLTAYDRIRDTYERMPSAQGLAALDIGLSLLIQELQRPGTFDLGQLVMTHGADEAMRAARQVPSEFLLRHKHGDWGDLPPEDIQENAWALANGARLFSAYRTRTEEKLWVITEWDRRCAASPVVGSLPQAARSGGTI